MQYLFQNIEIVEIANSIFEPNIEIIEIIEIANSIVESRYWTFKIIEIVGSNNEIIEIIEL